MRRTLWAAALALAAFLGGATRADDAPAPRTREAVRADEFLAAHKAGDDARMAALTAPAGPSAIPTQPFVVADEMLARTFAAALDDPARSAGLAAARVYAARVARQPGEARLAEHVERVAALDAAGRARETRLRDHLARAQAAIRRGDPAAALAACEAADDDVAAAAPSLAAGALLVARAWSFETSGRPADAVAAFLAAHRVREAAGWRFGAGDARRNAHRILREVGDFGGALALLRAEIDAFAAVGHVRGVLGNSGNLGCVYARLGEFDLARKAFRESADGFEALGDRRSALLMRANFGHVLAETGMAAAGLELLEEARTGLLEHGATSWATAALDGIAFARLRQGHLGLAIHAYEEALAERRRDGDAYGEIHIETSLGGVYAGVGDDERALDHLRRALAGQTALGMRWAAARTRITIGRVLTRTGDTAAGAAYLDDASAALRALGSRSGLGEALLERGNCALAAGDVALAAARFGEAESAARATGELHVVAAAILGVAATHARTGRPVEALASFDRALAIAEPIGDDPSVAAARTLRGWTLLGLRRPREAIDDARRASDALSRMSRFLGFDEGEGLRTAARDAANLGVEACRRLGAGDPASADAAADATFGFLEAGRALLLADDLRHRDAAFAGRIPEAVVREEAAARLRVGAARHDLVLAAARVPADTAAIDEARERLELAYRAARDAAAGVARASRVAAESAFPQPASTTEIRAALAADAALVLYHVGGDDPLARADGRAAVGAEADANDGAHGGHATAVVVTPSAVVALDLGPASEITSLAEAYLRCAATPATDPRDEAAQAEALHRALLAPVHAAAPEARRLLVSPDGVLAFLPFEALVEPQDARDARGAPAAAAAAAAADERPRRAIERWEFVYVPSGTVLVQLAERSRGVPRGEGIVALGDPTYPGEADRRAAPSASRRDAQVRGLDGLGRLARSGDEVRAVAALYPAARRQTLLRDAATPAALLRALAAAPGRLAAVHVACHGIVEPSRPALSGLVLADGEMMAADDFARLDLRADVAVLSACDTGRGRLVRGEGVVGLVRALFVAGCPRVVVSLRHVADASTCDLMTEFHRGMRTSGLSPSAALRAAKLAMLRDASAPSRARPYHWAPFVLWGLPE